MARFGVGEIAGFDVIGMRIVAAKRVGQDLYVLHSHIDAGVFNAAWFARQVVAIGHVDWDVCFAADLLHNRGRRKGGAVDGGQ